MGKYKFRFSDMIPNKLKDMSSRKPRSNKHHSLPNSQINSDHRKSYYFSRDHPDSPINPRTTNRIESDSVSPPSPEESAPDQSSSSGRGSAADSMVSWSNPCKCGNIITAGDDHCRRLKPIITKKDEIRTSAPSIKEDAARRAPAKSPGMRLRVNSPRIANRRIQGRKSVSRRSISDSFAVVKASRDPRRDFRESMVEMIMENNIKASKDLEELLACYLSLNSDEYHDLIINVFKQIWFDFVHPRLN